MAESEYVGSLPLLVHGKDYEAIVKGIKMKNKIHRTRFSNMTHYLTNVQMQQMH